MTGGVFSLDPLTDPRWDDLVAQHPAASIFHTRGWLDALRRTYDYEPVVLTTTAAGPLDNGLVLCRMRTWLSRRLVSLPFSDHCAPLVSNESDLHALLAWLKRSVDRGDTGSVEIRARTAIGDLAPAGRYCLHVLDLAAPLESVFRRFHPSSTRRAIRRAEREALTYDAGQSERLLTAFYDLLRLTRRRHGLPPQPIAWFRNLVACLGQRLVIHVASKNGNPIASIVTLRFGSVMTYKYGGSDARHHALGGMPFLFWRAVRAAHRDGCVGFDLGRSDVDQPGLLAFKDHLGATRHELTYGAYPVVRTRPGRGPLGRSMRRVLPHLPDSILDQVGRLMYRFVG